MAEVSGSKPPISSKASRTGETLRRLAKNPLIRPPLLTFLSLVSGVDEKEIKLNDDALSELKEIQEKRYELFKKWRRNIEETPGSGLPFMDVSGILPWLRDAHRLTAYGMFDSYEPISRLLLPETGDKGELEYISIRIKSLFTPKPASEKTLDGLLALEEIDKYFYPNEVPKDDLYRASVHIHAHPTLAPMNMMDVGVFLIDPESLAEFVFAKGKVYAAFVTDKTPIIDLASWTKELSAGREVLPRKEIRRLVTRFANFQYEALTPTSDPIKALAENQTLRSYRYQWQETQSFCIEYGIELFVGELNLAREDSLTLYHSASVLLDWR